MDNTLYKWNISGPGYSRAGICFALSESGVKAQLKARGYNRSDEATVQEIDTSTALHVLSEYNFHENHGCN